ncbi:unnamed protein product, partial [Mesorhabditis belari]|uniref:Gustatory receptor n=1 Tax=Mesorhabditis belari TaxID=2138241 RepID=A0AAF3EMB4_9BILA
MYPFNRLASMNAGDERNHSRHQTIVPKSFMANIVEMSLLTNGWKEELGVPKDEEPFIDACSESPSQGPTMLPFRNVKCFSRSIGPVLQFLRMIAFFPGIFQNSNRRRDRRFIRAIYFLLYNFSILVILLNCFLSKVTIEQMMFYQSRFGLMHSLTVSSIVSGIKPLINAVVILIFIINIKAHYRLISTVDTVDLCFRAAFHTTPNTAQYICVFFCISFFFFFTPLILFVVEFFSFGEFIHLGSFLDFRFLLVPMLSLWNIVPLLYYDMYNRIVRFYCRILIHSLDKEHLKRHFSLKFYYEQFLRITNVQEAIGGLFNPYLFFSLAWSMAILCLSIYFVTQPSEDIFVTIAPEYQSVDFQILIKKKVKFAMSWSFIQVFVASLNVLMICWSGMQTNETTREIVDHVLRIVPDANADLDRFQISCFVHKMTTQFMWGMTVWRAFLLQRTTFFTLISVIITYAFLLLKLKENPELSPKSFNIQSSGNLNTTTTIMTTILMMNTTFIPSTTTATTTTTFGY